MLTLARSLLVAALLAGCGSEPVGILRPGGLAPPPAVVAATSTVAPTSTADTGAVLAWARVVTTGTGDGATLDVPAAYGVASVSMFGANAFRVTFLGPVGTFYAPTITPDYNFHIGTSPARTASEVYFSIYDLATGAYADLFAAGRTYAFSIAVIGAR